jgi:hypothetical protein
MADPLLSSAQFAGDHNQARLERKRAESDAVLLANRIALLKVHLLFLSSNHTVTLRAHSKTIHANEVHP